MCVCVSCARVSNIMCVSQEVWADRTAAPDRHKLLSEGIYEYVTSRRPNKWRHAFTAKDVQHNTTQHKTARCRLSLTACFTSYIVSVCVLLSLSMQYLKATNKQKKITIRFAAGDSCLQAVSTALLRYQEAESRAVRGAVKPIIIIETCDGWR